MAEIRFGVQRMSLSTAARWNPGTSSEVATSRLSGAFLVFRVWIMSPQYGPLVLASLHTRYLPGTPLTRSELEAHS